MQIHTNIVLTVALLFAGSHPEAIAYVTAAGATNSQRSRSPDNTVAVGPPIATQEEPASPTAGSLLHTSVVLRFAVQDEPRGDAAALSFRACPEPGPQDTATPPAPLNVDPKILDDISEELEKKLAKKMSVLVNPAPENIPENALIVSGCITRASGGNAVGRMAGMNIGDSLLSAHIIVFSKTAKGLKPLDDFDEKIKGGALLPPLGPIGLVAHAAREPRETLSADAKKLADHALKKFAKDMKARKQAMQSTIA